MVLSFHLVRMLAIEEQVFFCYQQKPGISIQYTHYEGNYVFYTIIILKISQTDLNPLLIYEVISQIWNIWSVFPFPAVKRSKLIKYHWIDRDKMNHQSPCFLTPNIYLYSLSMRRILLSKFCVYSINLATAVREETGIKNQL